MTDTTYKRKLIEVALPLDTINREAAREKSIRHGHPSTLHLWWARRPLAACRAVLFAQLVDDPSAHPEEFPTEELQEKERQRLFGIIERLVKWENSNNETVLDETRTEIRKSCEGDPPPVLDPFAGGGSIPLEAQRLGLKAYASDLNPVAVLINKALIEIPPRWAGRPPVHPHDDGRLDTQTWDRAQGLADDFDYYSKVVRGHVERNVAALYPALPDGRQVAAWMWGRTIECPNPACSADVVLAKSFWLSKQASSRVWLEPSVAGRELTFHVRRGEGAPTIDGTVSRSGATCLVCGNIVPTEGIRRFASEHGFGARLLALAIASDSGARDFATPESVGVDSGMAEVDLGLVDAEVPSVGLSGKAAVNVPLYGLDTTDKLFTDRQLVYLTRLCSEVASVRSEVAQDALSSGFSAADAEDYASSIATYLGLAVGKIADISNALCQWAYTRAQPSHLFPRQAIPMVWDFVEVSPFVGYAGDLSVVVRTMKAVVERLPASCEAEVAMKDAREAFGRSDDGCLTTDPPYYDNIAYSDLSDFFYVWLRSALKGVYPELFNTMVTPKADELVATPYRFGGNKHRAERFFEERFVQVCGAANKHQAAGVPLTMFYAFKQSETDPAGGAVASTGWETMLEGLISADLMVTATWPMRTELANKIGMKANMLASSIVLACRPRSEVAGITDRRGFLDALRSDLPQALREMQQGSVAPVDLAQSSIGPGMAVFAYAKVLEPSGEPMRVRAALGLINQVLDEVLAEQEGDFDAETRWAIKWFSQYGFDDGPFGDAETLCKATGTAINGMQRSGILGSKASKVWLIGREDLPVDWDPASDDRVPVWEATQQLVKALDEGGESAAADLLARLGGVGETARELAYRLYAICDQKKWAKEAGAYNALVTSWPEVKRKAAEGPSGQGSLL